MNYFITVNYYSNQCLKNLTEAAGGIKQEKRSRQQQDIWVHTGLQLNCRVFCPFTPFSNAWWQWLVYFTCCSKM